MDIQESSQVDSSTGGSLNLIKPQDVITDGSNPIDSNLSSVQTMETNSGVCETEGKTPSEVLFEQENRSLVLSDAKDINIDETLQETSIPLSDISLANSNSVVAKKDRLPVDQSIPQGDSVGQDELCMGQDIHSIDQQRHSTDQDVQPMDVDMQSVNQDKESSDQGCQENQLLDQDSEDDNPFSHLLLLSDSDNNDNIPLKTSKKKCRKAKPSSGGGGSRRKAERITPDSFVAVQFSSPELRHKLELVQQHMVKMDKKLKPTMIPLVKLHVTLMTLQLNNDESLIEK